MSKFREEIDNSFEAFENSFSVKQPTLIKSNSTDYFNQSEKYLSGNQIYESTQLINNSKSEFTKSPISDGNHQFNN